MCYLQLHELKGIHADPDKHTTDCLFVHYNNRRRESCKIMAIKLSVPLPEEQMTWHSTSSANGWYADGSNNRMTCLLLHMTDTHTTVRVQRSSSEATTQLPAQTSWDCEGHEPNGSHSCLGSPQIAW